MMVFSQPCGDGTTRMIRGDFSSISVRCREALCFFCQLMESVCSLLNDPGNTAANLKETTP